MAFQTTSAIACEHAVPFSVTCPHCVMAAWESAPPWPAPRRLRHEVLRDEQLERQAEERASIREWEAGVGW